MNIIQAAEVGDVERVRQLIAEGIDVNKSNWMGSTALIEGRIF
jgi:hypothetical protein